MLSCCEAAIHVDIIVKQGEKTLPLGPGLPQGNVPSRLPAFSVLWVCPSSCASMGQRGSAGALPCLVKRGFVG